MEKTFETTGPLRLDLRIPAGSIEIVTDEAAQTVVTLQGDADALETAIVDLRGDELRVEIPERRGFLGFRHPEVRLEIRCPQGSSAAVRTRSADLRARGTLGRVESTGASGDVDLERVDGAVALKSASGDLRLIEAGGDVTAHTASGDVEIGHARGDLAANLVSGDLSVRAADGSVSANSVSGDVRLSAVVAGTVSVSSVSGDVEVGVRRGSRIHVDASTLSGDTRSELDLGGEPVTGDGPIVELRIKTVSGDVSVVRAPAPISEEVQQS
jgi:DUF4097 and DUF4098 domain-containing protein YvlB